MSQRKADFEKSELIYIVMLQYDDLYSNKLALWTNISRYWWSAGCEMTNKSFRKIIISLQENYTCSEN